MKNKYTLYFFFVVMICSTIVFGFSLIAINPHQTNSYAESGYWISLMFLSAFFILSLIFVIKNKDNNEQK